MKIIITLIICFSIHPMMQAQTNTAVTSGSIGKCAVWDYPYTLYNNAGGTQNVNNGITVTVDQNRAIGAIGLVGSGAMDFSGANGITMSGSAGDIGCRWDIGAAGNGSIVNNNGVFSKNSRGISSTSYITGAFFAAPYAGVYRWSMGSGWAASMGGSYLNGGFGIQKQGNDYYGNIFYQNSAGSCGTLSGAVAGPTWTSSLTPITLTAGQQLYYAGSTAYFTGGACTNTTLNFTLGTATIFYEN